MFVFAQVLVGLRKQFINNSVFPTWSCGAGFRDDNNNNNSLCCTRSIGAPCDLFKGNTVYVCAGAGLTCL